MSSTPLPNTKFARYQDENGRWASGCLLCLTIVGTAESFEELSALENVHECFEKKPPQSVRVCLPRSL